MQSGTIESHQSVWTNHFVCKTFNSVRPTFVQPTEQRQTHCSFYINRNTKSQKFKLNIRVKQIKCLKESNVKSHCLSAPGAENVELEDTC